MTWQAEANKHVNTPVIFVSVAFNSGTRYYSTNYIETASQGYKGNVLNLPEISSSIGDIKRTYERNKITIIFNDSDYEFRGLEESETAGLRNRTVTIKLGFAEDNYANLLTLYTGQIYDWERLEGLRFKIDIEEKNRNLSNTYPDKNVERSDYPNADGS